MILTTLLYGWSGQYLTWLIPKNYSMDVFYIANDVLTFTSGNPACSSSTLQSELARDIGSWNLSTPLVDLQTGADGGLLRATS